MLTTQVSRLVLFRTLYMLKKVEFVIILLCFYLIALLHSANPFKPPCWTITEQTNSVKCNEHNTACYLYCRASVHEVNVYFHAHCNRKKEKKQTKLIIKYSRLYYFNILFCYLIQVIII